MYIQEFQSVIVSDVVITNKSSNQSSRLWRKLSLIKEREKAKEKEDVACRCRGEKAVRVLWECSRIPLNSFTKNINP